MLNCTFNTTFRNARARRVKHLEIVPNFHPNFQLYKSNTPPWVSSSIMILTNRIFNLNFSNIIGKYKIYINWILRALLRFYASVQMFYLQLLGDFKNILDKICLKSVVGILSNSQTLLSLYPVFHKITTLKNFTNFKGKLLQQSPFFLKLLFQAYSLQLYYGRDSDTVKLFRGVLWTTAFVCLPVLANVSAILMWQSKESRNYL